VGWPIFACSEGRPTILDDTLLANLPEAARTLFAELKGDGLVEISPAPPSSGGRYIPTHEESEEVLRRLIREHDEGKTVIEYFSHKGKPKFVYREYVPDAEHIAGTTGVYEYIGTILLAIQQHGEQMIKWYVEKTAKADIALQKRRDIEARKENENGETI